MLRLKSLLSYKFGFFLVTLLLFVGYFLNQYIKNIYSAEHSEIKIIALQSSQNKLDQALSKTKMTLVIEQQTIKEMNNTLLQLQSQVIEQQLALRFYQKVMAPGDTANGVKIEQVSVEAGISAGHYRFDILIAQLEKRKRYIRGKLFLSLVGSELGQSKTIELNPLLMHDNVLKFSFRYFQSLKGEINLPSDFTPEKLIVSLKMSKRRGQKSALIEQEFTWQKVLVIPLKPLIK